jgi:hypothetical protein
LVKAKWETPNVSVASDRFILKCGHEDEKTEGVPRSRGNCFYGGVTDLFSGLQSPPSWPFFAWDIIFWQARETGSGQENLGIKPDLIPFSRYSRISISRGKSPGDSLKTL